MTMAPRDEETAQNLAEKKIGKRSIFDMFTNWRQRLTGMAATTTQRSIDDVFDELYHPTVISNEDKWIAGCLMQCVFRRNNAVDDAGYPTLDGITDLYTAGNTEQQYFMHVLRAVDRCLKSVSIKYKIHKGHAPLKGETCDVAFDVFDCVSDSVTEYCNG